jgi:hypothetical protein
MGQKLTSKEEINELLKDYDPLKDERLILTHNEKGYVFEPGEYLLFDKTYVIYLGFIKDIKSIDPNIYCIYRIGGKVYYQKPKPLPLDINGLVIKTKKEFDNSRLLDVTIKQNDNDLMVIAKNLLNGMSLNQFKSLFDNVSTLNNFRREIESSTSGNLTWNRFTYLLDLLGCEYELNVITPSVKNGVLQKPQKEISISEQKI